MTRKKQRGFLLNPFRFDGGTPGGDPHFSNVSLLLHFDGVNGATVFPDSSSHNRAMTPYGGAQIGTDQSRFGGASLKLNGSSDYVETPSTADLNFNNDPFTFECLFRCAVNTTAQQCVAAKYASASVGWTVQVFSGKLIVTLSGDGIDMQGTKNLVAGQWYHVALSGQAGAIRLFLDGVQDGPTYSGAVSLGGASTLRVGRNVGPAYFNGHIDELRITKGVARYTANFTPPNTPFPNS